MPRYVSHDKSRPPFTAADGLAIQRQDIERWTPALSAPCLSALRAHIEAENRKPLPDGFAVFRGSDFANFILNWKPK